MIVAELVALLGLDVDSAAWKAGEKAIEGVKTGLSRLAKWGAMALGAAGAGAVVLSDSYTGLENRIRQVSGSQDELNELMDRTRAIANDTRSDWGATGEAFVRLKNSTKDMGLTTDRTLAIVETLNMALQSSGASASEAAAGTLQLMQGLSAGALQGDEFRSIAEQLPDLMDLFAKEMGVSRGKLKELGAQGKITSKVVVSSLENASDSIREKFAKSTATAAQGWVVLKNNLTLAAGEFIRSTGIVEKLGAAVKRITAWVEGNRDQIRAFGKAVGEGFETAFGVIARVIQFFAENEELTKSILTGLAIAAGAMAVAWIAAQLPILAVLAALTALGYAVRYVIKNWDRLRGSAERVVERVVAAFKRAGSAIAAPFIAAFNIVKSIVVSIVNFVIDKLNWLIDKTNWVIRKMNKLPGIDVAQIDTIDRVGGTPGGASIVPDQLGNASATSTSSTSNSVTVNAPITVHAAPGMDEAKVASIAKEGLFAEFRAAADSMKGGHA